jgi:hypothetical protein
VTDETDISSWQLSADVVTNPVEENVVTRLLLGFAVIFAMMLGGGAVGSALDTTPLPYGGVLGVGTGALLVFVGFAVLYRRYDASVRAE